MLKTAVVRPRFESLISAPSTIAAICILLLSSSTYSLPKAPEFVLSKSDKNYFEQLSQSLNQEKEALLSISKTLQANTPKSAQLYSLAAHEVKTDNSFSSGFVMQGIGEISIEKTCKGLKHGQLLMLQSLDGAAELESRYRELSFTQANDNILGEYESFYRYVVPVDKINTEYATSGEYKQQFNGIVMQEKHPGNRKELLDKNTQLIITSKQTVLDTINNAQTSLSIIEAPEDIENSAVLNQITIKPGFDKSLRILLSKSFVMQDNAWVFDGYGIELINLHGVSLYRQLAMASGVSLSHKATTAKYLSAQCNS